MKTFTTDADSRDTMRASLKSLIESAGEVRVSVDWLRSMFAGKKEIKAWAKEAGMTVDRDEGGAVFRKAFRKVN